MSDVNWQDRLFLACLFLLSLTILSLAHFMGDPDWLEQLPVSQGSDGILWQVQTTFLSVGFAGLAIAAQLFAETPLAVGASRGRVLEHVWAGWFVGFGLMANVVIAVETIWLPSSIGMVAATLVFFVPTLVLLVLSYVRLMRLFGRPSLLDEVVRASLVGTMAERLATASRKYALARAELDGLFDTGHRDAGAALPSVTLRVPVPRTGAVIKAIRPQIVRQALASLAPQATEGGDAENDIGPLYMPPQVSLAIEPGDRTRLGETAFRVSVSEDVDLASRDRLVQLLQSSIEFEPPGSVTPDEETDREIANIKDAIGTSLRSGAYSTAERALELLGQVVRGVWTADTDGMESSRRSSLTRRDWLFRSIADVEQDALISPRAAGLFVGQSMTRALEAPRTGSTDYVDECLRSFTRLWSDVLRHGDDDFEALPGRITTCLQNLAAFSFSTFDQRDELQERAIWAIVELVKSALDAKDLESAKLAARELNGLFEFAGRDGLGRAHVRGGQLVLLGWLDFLADKGDERDIADTELRALVSPDGSWPEILTARNLAERKAAPFSPWDWWEVNSSGRAQVLELSEYIDRAVLRALASSYGTLPPIRDQDTAADYKRYLRFLTEQAGELKATHLERALAEEVGRWDAAEDDHLAEEPLSAERIDALREALRSTLNEGNRLADQLPTVIDLSDVADASRPILGMNFRVPRHYLVDRIFNQVYADPKDLGEMIARGFIEAEELRILSILHAQSDDASVAPTARAIRDRIDALGDDSAHYVLLTPFGGLGELDEWYSPEFRESLGRITHIEMGALDQEAILFDRRTTLESVRKPEEKVGMTPVEGTSISVGVFEDLEGQDEPQVRIESGEYFVVWPGQDPKIHRFIVDSAPLEL